MKAVDTPEKRRQYPKIFYRVLIPLFQFFQSGFPKIPTLSYLIRLFVESHIKEKLSELSIAYLYLIQTIPEDHPAAENYRAWLKDTSETCEKLSGTLNSLQSAKGLASIFWPILVNIAAALLGISTLKELFTRFSLANFLPWVIFIAIPFAYFFLFLTGAFWYKRELFMGAPFFESIMLSIFSLPDDRPIFPWLQDSTNNIYQLEDQVFNLLNRGKRHEFRWDILTMPFSFFVLALVGFSEWLNNPSQPISWPGIVGFLLAAVLSMAIISLRKWD